MSSSVEPTELFADRVFDEAGPPTSHTFVALLLGVVLFAMASSFGVVLDEPMLLLGSICAGTTGLVAVADRAGWRIRAAMAYIARQQATRWTRGSLPLSVEEARAWLADPVNGTASAVERGSVSCTANDWMAAESILVEARPASDNERVSVIRMTAAIRARTSGSMDLAAIRVAAARLSADDARFQISAAAWTRAWLDMAASRPWRRRFASELRDLGRLPLPIRTRVLIAAYQLSAPLVTIAGSALIAIIT